MADDTTIVAAIDPIPKVATVATVAVTTIAAPTTTVAAFNIELQLQPDSSLSYSCVGS